MTEREAFEAALELAPEARAGFLEAASGGDPAMHARLAALLGQHDQAGSFLESPAADLGRTTDQPESAERPGTVIGPYKLLEQIGEGGFGVVFLAEQQEPVRRKVALKVLKAGMDTRQVVARFEAERQALAIMDHPNIAKVHDGGVTPSGRPYFVMELVKGTPITDFCDQHHMTPRQRLELFVPVCQAIQHAHQKGIIHRDIKPSNVLVSRHDSTPVVKVIDFGVAKALGQTLTDKTLFTGLAQMIGTPLYMSPEQAGMSDLDVDTRSDIYSLGVLLYELLTGTTPFDKHRFRQAGYDEIRRIIREEDPPRPSTRISTLGLAADTVSAQRQTEPAKLTRLVRGELDWIVMRALEKDRARRYEAAAALAADVQRYLADEPVLACPPSARYRLRKFVRRNRRAVATASAAAVVVVLATGGLAVGTVLFDRAEARAARDLATAQAEARSRLESRLYRHRIALAELEWSVNNLSRMEELLAQCPVDLREWEWHYLKRLRYSPQTPLHHERPVVEAAFSLPDGQHLATCTHSGIVRIWHAETGRKVLEWQAHEANATSVRFSPDGRYLATASWDNTVKVWELERVREQVRRDEAPKPHRRWEHGTNRVWRVDFSPDGRRVASAGGKEADHKGEMNVWDLDTGQRAFPTKTFTWAVRGVQFSPDGRRLATACGERVQVWDAQTGEEVQLPFPCIDRHGLLEEVAFSPDGRRLAAVGGTMVEHPNREVKVWDATTGEAVFSLSGHVGGLHGVTFSPDSRRIASSGLDQTVKVWDATTGEEVLTLRGHLDNIMSVAFSPDGCKLASASVDGTVRVWDGRPLEREPTPEFRTLAGHVGAVFDVAFHPKDGRTLVSSGMDRTVREWDFQAGTELASRQWTNLGLRPKVAYSPDGRRLAVSQGKYPVRVWDTTTGTGTESPPFRRHTAAVTALAFSPDSRHVASTDFDSIVRVWDPTTAQEVRVLWDTAPAQEGSARKGQNGPNAIAFGPDGRHLVTGSADSTVRVWDLKSAEERPARRLPHTGRVAGVAFSRDGKWMASASWGRSVKVWDTDSWQPAHELPQPSAIQCVAFDRDGPRLAWGGTDGTVTVWDGPGMKPHVLRGHTSWVQAVTFSPDGQWIASASLDGTLKIWRSPLESKVPAPREVKHGE